MRSIHERTSLHSQPFRLRGLNSSSLIRLERDLGEYDSQGDTAIAAIASLYRLDRDSTADGHSFRRKG